MPLSYKRFRNKETWEIWEIPEGRYGNFLAYVKKLTNYISINMPKFYVVHLTLTVAENVQEVNSDHLKRVTQFISQRLKRLDTMEILGTPY